MKEKLPSNVIMSENSLENSYEFSLLTPLNIQQSSSFDEWLSKNNIRYITSNEFTEEIHKKESDSIVNVFNVLHSWDVQTVSTEKQCGTITVSVGDVNGKSCINSTKIDKNKNLLKDCNKTKNNTQVNIKCDKIERCKNIYLEIIQDKDRIKVCICHANGKEILLSHYISAQDAGGHLNVPYLKRQVTSINRIIISNTLNVFMPSLKIETGLTVFICPLADCNQAYFRITNAKLHALVHIGHKPFKCNFPNCTWAFYTAFKLRRHEETHAKKKDFICTYPGCERRFTTIYNLNGHKRRHEKIADLPCPVKNCNSMFQNTRDRQLHLKTHTIQEAPFICSILSCKKAFFFESALQTHTRSHSHKDSELRCQWVNCGRVFEQPSKLKAHSRIHTGQRPYRCLHDDCKWSFTTASKLRRHESTHTNERKFHCTIGTCNKSFLRSEHLKDHTLTHIGQRSFQCEVCAVSFVTKPNLYLHIKKSHPEKNQACARAVPYSQSSEKPSADVLLEQAVQSLGVPSDMILGTGLLPDEPLELLENENFSTVNLRDLE